VIYVFSAGNNGDEGDNVNYNSLEEQPVFAADRGAAPGRIHRHLQHSGSAGAGGRRLVARFNARHRALLTTDRVGTNGYNTAKTTLDLANKDYTAYFNGTSASAPLVSGRGGAHASGQHQSRLAGRAGNSDPHRQEGGADRSRLEHQQCGIRIQPLLRRGARAGASRGEAGQDVDQSSSGHSGVSRSEREFELNVPDANTNGVTQELTFDGSGIRIEHALITVDAVHTSRGQMTISLISPSGMVSRLAERHSDTNGGWPMWTFLPRRHWGESSAGTWKVRFTDTVAKETGYVRSVRIDFLGTPIDPVTVITNQVAEIPGAGGNGNGAVDPGETIDLGVWLGNQGNQTASRA
jgi:subtilisin-like proprotein convertase family protein